MANPDTSKAVDYCINCDNEVDWYYFNEDGLPMGLCQTCSEAFELGQINPECNLIPENDLSQYLQDDEDGTSGQDRKSYSDSQDRDNYTVDRGLELDEFISKFERDFGATDTGMFAELIDTVSNMVESGSDLEDAIFNAASDMRRVLSKIQEQYSQVHEQ